MERVRRRVGSFRISPQKGSKLFAIFQYCPCLYCELLVWLRIRMVPSLLTVARPPKLTMTNFSNTVLVGSINLGERKSYRL